MTDAFLLFKTIFTVCIPAVIVVLAVIALVVSLGAIIVISVTELVRWLFNI